MSNKDQGKLREKPGRSREQINLLKGRIKHLIHRLRDYKKVEEYNIRTLESLEKSERRYRMVVEDQTEFIARFKRDYTLTFANEALCRYFGKSHDQIIGRSFMPIVPPGDREMIKKVIASLCKENPASSYYQRIESTKGKVRWQHWTNRAIFDKEGKIVEYQAIGRDITERKKFEIALKKSEQILLEQNKKLKKKNMILHEILEQIEIEKQTIKEDMFHNIKITLVPLINKIKIEQGEIQEKYIMLLESQLNTISSKLGRKLVSLQDNLSKREIEVCNLISNGLSTKEIAFLLHISLNTAETHRNNIRKKLGLNNKKVNLFSYLQG